MLVNNSVRMRASLFDCVVGFSYLISARVMALPYFLSPLPLPSFPQLILFIAENLECNKEDCEALIHMLKTFLKQLMLSREVRVYHN